MRSMRSFSQHLVRILLGSFMIFAGYAHLTIARQEFVAQVPVWLPINTDFVVLASGVVELLLGLSLLFSPGKYRKKVGIALAIFYILIFPGNINQYLEGISAFGLDTDTKRFVRLLFQPLLIVLALWAAGIPAAKKK